MKCPHCNETLIMTERQRVEIDYCRKCRGVWLDRGELDKIIERSSGFNSQYDNDQTRFSSENNSSFNKNDPHYKHKKKKGFLEDLFDFD
jgi:uncharacterized protein